MKIITTIEGKPRVLDMSDPRDYDDYILECRAQARERASIKSRLHKARRRTIKHDLTWSGHPLILGYAVTQKQRFSSGRYVRPQEYVYQPHVDIVEAALEIGDRPTTIFWSQWAAICRAEGVVVPPFDASIREFVGPKSLYWDHGYADMSQPHALTVSNLKAIVACTQHVGDRLYGTGRSGKYVQKKVRQIEQDHHVALDCTVSEHRKFIDNQPSLVIHATEDQNARK